MQNIKLFLGQLNTRITARGAYSIRMEERHYHFRHLFFPYISAVNVKEPSFRFVLHYYTSARPLVSFVLRRITINIAQYV